MTTTAIDTPEANDILAKLDDAINTPEANDFLAKLDDVLSTINSFIDDNQDETQIIAMSNSILDTLESIMEQVRRRYSYPRRQRRRVHHARPRCGKGTMGPGGGNFP